MRSEPWRRALSLWERFVGRVVATGYGPHPDDYVHSLWERGQLQAAVEHVPESEYAQRLQVADAAFRGATIEQRPSPLRAYFEIGEEWWWFRIPRRGELSERLRRDEDQWGPPS